MRKLFWVPVVLVMFSGSAWAAADDNACETLWGIYNVKFECCTTDFPGCQGVENALDSAGCGTVMVDLFGNCYLSKPIIPIGECPPNEPNIGCKIACSLPPLGQYYIQTNSCDCVYLNCDGK